MCEHRLRLQWLAHVVAQSVRSAALAAIATAAVAAAAVAAAAAAAVAAAAVAAAAAAVAAAIAAAIAAAAGRYTVTLAIAATSVTLAVAATSVAAAVANSLSHYDSQPPSASVAAPCSSTAATGSFHAAALDSRGSRVLASIDVRNHSSLRPAHTGCHRRGAAPRRLSDWLRLLLPVSMLLR